MDFSNIRGLISPASRWPAPVIASLRNVAETESEMIALYDSAFRSIDTPEFKEKLEHFKDQHAALLADIRSRLDEGLSAESDFQIALHDHEYDASPVGDTLDTYKALEDIIAGERIARERYEELASHELPDDAVAFMDRIATEAREREEFLMKAEQSLKAAVSLWGPSDLPPILHH